MRRDLIPPPVLLPFWTTLLNTSVYGVLVKVDGVQGIFFPGSTVEDDPGQALSTRHRFRIGYDCPPEIFVNFLVRLTVGQCL